MSNLHGGNVSCLFLLMGERPKMHSSLLSINSHAIENNCYYDHVNFPTLHALHHALFQSSPYQSIVLVTLTIWKACLIKIMEAFMHLWPFLIILHDLHILKCLKYSNSSINLEIHSLS